MDLLSNLPAGRVQSVYIELQIELIAYEKIFLLFSVTVITNFKGDRM